MTDPNLIDYQSLFESLPNAYVAFQANDPTFTIIAENKAHAVMANVKTSEILGKPLFEVWPDVSEKYKKTGVSDLVESLRTVIRTGKSDTMPTLHYDIPDSKGNFQERFWRVSHHPLKDESGTVVAVYQATQDITDEMTTGARLKQTERQLEEALSSGVIGTWLWDVSENAVIGDRYMARMFGVSETEAAAGIALERFVEGIYPEDRPRVQKEIEKALKKGSAFNSEYRAIGSDGNIRWINARGRIERDKSGKPTQFPGVLIDITERKFNENNLRFLAQAGAVLSESLNYSHTLDAICKLAVPTIGDWCTVQMINNDGQLESVAIAHKDPEKTKWAIELNKRQGPTSLDEPTGAAQVIRSGKPEFYPEITDEMIVASTSDPKQLKLLRDLGMSSVIIAPITIDKTTIGVLSLISAEQKRHYTRADLEMAQSLASRASIAITNARLFDEAQTELKARTALEEKLRIANEELEQRVVDRTIQLEETNTSLQRSNQELQDFAYVASHDLQEPLRKIQAFGNLLEDEHGDTLGDGKDYLDRMRGAAARMSALIEDILSFSRVTTKARGFEPVDLTVVAREVIEDLETRIKDTGATVQIEKLPTIDADAMQIRQLLQNLIANALKFHKPDVAPLVKISATTDISHGKRFATCTIKIQDNGVGFDEKYLDRIFAVFQRLHSRDAYEGTGIGLAVCRKITERHGGTITAASKPGKGATFIVTLPMRHKKGEPYAK